MAVQKENPTRVTPQHIVTSCEVWCQDRNIFSTELLGRNETRSQHFICPSTAARAVSSSRKSFGELGIPPRASLGGESTQQGLAKAQGAPGEEPPLCLLTEFTPTPQQVKPILENTAQKCISPLPSLPPGPQMHPEMLPCITCELSQC